MFFDVLLKNSFLEKCQDRYMLLKKEFPNKNDTERWDSHEIDKMFGKGLNHNSLITNYESLTWLLNDSKEIDTIIEFGPGAGWSTVIMYRLLRVKKHNPLLFSIDISTHSIAASTVLLDYYEIPWLLIRNIDEYKYDLIINATPLGKYYFDRVINGFSSPLSLKILENISKPNTILQEMNYFPIETSFLEMGRYMGFKTISGVLMLVFQAIESYKRYFGEELTESTINIIIEKMIDYVKIKENYVYNLIV